MEGDVEELDVDEREKWRTQTLKFWAYEK